MNRHCSMLVQPARLGTLAFAALLLTACASGRPEPQQVGGAELRGATGPLRKADGTLVDVPASGGLADPRALELAKSIRAYDARRFEPNLLPGVADSALREATIALATAMRDEALDQLDLAYRVARRTSATMDGALLANGQASMRKAAELLSRPPPRLFVRTQINSSPPINRLEYMTAADFRKSAGSWLSYSYGQSMKLGLYVFRLRSAVGDALHKVEVMTDPLVHTLDSSPTP